MHEELERAMLEKSLSTTILNLRIKKENIISLRREVAEVHGIKEDIERKLRNKIVDLQHHVEKVEEKYNLLVQEKNESQKVWQLLNHINGRIILWLH